MPSNLEVAVIILNWNNAPDTLECLASVYKTKGVSFRVYVADNGSTDGSLEKIREAYPEATYIENGANLGFAEGNNRAIREALRDDPAYIFLLNNDATLHEEALAILKRAAENYPNAAALGPKIYYYDDPSTIWYAGGDWDPARASFFHHEWGDEDLNSKRREITPTGYVVGCAFFIRSWVCRQIGLMDPDYFLNWEEIDWCWRIRNAGYDCLYVPEAKAWHKVSRSFEGGKKGAVWRYFYWRNRLLWMKRHLPRKERYELLRQIVWPQVKTLVKEALFDPNPRPARAALRGILDHLCNRYGPMPK